MIKTKIGLILISFAICLSLNASDDINVIYQDQYSQSAHGGIGLIKTPTARFSNDGELTFGISAEAPYNRLFAKMQFFPWLETVVKYSELTSQDYNIVQTNKDKGFDVKIKLFEESEFFPSVALGLNDFAGTGVFSSEYLVASKAFRNFDLSLGLGWGKLGGKDHLSNIIGWFDDSRNARGGCLPNCAGGTLSFDRFFSGENTSVFGGLEYFTPIENLSFKLEYDTSDYSDILGKEMQYDEVGDIVELDSRLNFAMNYRLNLSERDNVDLSLGIVRGNTIYANFAVHSNLNFSGTPKIVMGAEQLREPSLESYTSLSQDWKKYVNDTIIWEMANSGFVTHTIIYNGDELAAEISQSRFKDASQAIDLASRVLANNSPRDIRKITIINVDTGIETLRSTVLREDLVESVSYGPLDENLVEFDLSEKTSSEAIIIQNEFLYPNFYWEIKPILNNTLQHQEKFFFWQLEANIHSVYSIKKGLYFTTDIGINIDNNFENYTYHIPDGELHNVRQDRRLYLTEGETGIRKMAFDYLIDINQNLKAKLSLGYLEWMYGGFGGELLYFPDQKRWALGVDAHWVKQRDFDQRFSFRDYQTITGFISYYQNIPFYDMRLKVSAGKFLGKDVGMMVDVSRRFDNGARVGAFFALTDCDSVCVGEGSYHKGIYFELPMDIFYIQSTTRNKTGYSWSPLTKNAGARLANIELYEVVTDVRDEVDQIRQKPFSVKKILSGFSTKPKKSL